MQSAKPTATRRLAKRAVLTTAALLAVALASGVAQAQNWAGYWCNARADGKVMFYQVERPTSAKIKYRVRLDDKEAAAESEILEQSGTRYKTRDPDGSIAEGEFVSADRIREQQFDARGQKIRVVEIYRCADAEAAFTKRAAASGAQVGAYRPNDCELVPDADLSAKYDIESYHARGLAWRFFAATTS